MTDILYKKFQSEPQDIFNAMHQITYIQKMGGFVYLREIIFYERNLDIPHMNPRYI